MVLCILITRHNIQPIGSELVHIVILQGLFIIKCILYDVITACGVAGAHHTMP